MGLANVKPTGIDGLWYVELTYIEDEERPGASFTETFRSDELKAHGLPDMGVVQVNRSVSRFGTIRGIHVAPWHKYIFCGPGRAFAVIVDPRPGSKTYGKWESFELGPDNALFVSSGLGNSFQAVGSAEQPVYYYYMVNEAYRPNVEVGFDWADPALGVKWPLSGDWIKVSSRDIGQPSLEELNASGALDQFAVR